MTAHSLFAIDLLFLLWIVFNGKVAVASEEETESTSVGEADAKKRSQHESRDDEETSRAAKRLRSTASDQQMSEGSNPLGMAAEDGSDKPTDEAASPSATTKHSSATQTLWSAGSCPFSTPDSLSVSTEERERFLFIKQHHMFLMILIMLRIFLTYQKPDTSTHD